jgi:ribonuclease Z
VVLDVALVGTGGMMPLPHRWLSSVLIRYGRHLVLFDCGEGTQISLRILGWGIKDIDLILISHLHGDHIAGLPGLLLTQGNSGRTAPLQVVGPPGLIDAVQRLRVIAPYLPFDVVCTELDTGDAFALDDLRGTCAAGDHHIPCLAYRLDVPRRRQFDPGRARRLEVPLQYWKQLQSEESVSFDGRTVLPDEVLGEPRRGLSITLITDTRPTPALVRLAHDADLVVCEGTYGENDHQPRAVQRKHMTFAEAATLAKTAAARRLLLTHFSPALPEPEAFASSATEIFPETLVGHDHLTLSLTFN